MILDIDKFQPSQTHKFSFFTLEQGGESVGCDKFEPFQLGNFTDFRETRKEASEPSTGKNSCNSIEGH